LGRLSPIGDRQGPAIKGRSLSGWKQVSSVAGRPASRLSAGVRLQKTLRFAAAGSVKNPGK
jgi:hypothetical protein